MSDQERRTLEKKVEFANLYLGSLMKYRGRVLSTDIFSVVTRGMRDHVSIDENGENGVFVRFK